MGGHDWVYLLGLLVPFVVYDLALKASLIAALPERPNPAGWLGLMRSDLLFGLAYACLWVGLFAVARRGPFRRVVVVLFHLVTILVALVVTGVYRYFRTTGSMPDLDLVLASLSSPKVTGGAVASASSPGLLAVLGIALLYALVGPWLLKRLLVSWGERPSPGRGVAAAGVPWLGVFGLFLASYALFSFSLFPGGPPEAGKAFARDAIVSVAMTGAEETTAEEETTRGDGTVATEQPPPDASLLATGLERRNVVFVHLESTRARSVTPYNEELETTPFMDELAKGSIFAENARAVVPHTSNALVATMCGIDPPTTPEGTDSLGDRIPATCLPQLLKDQGYDSVYFTSSVQTFERRPEVVKNMGYEEFYPVETMDKEGFEKANYFGYEDDIMLEPSRRWLEGQKKTGAPFVAAYETITPHHDYQAPDRYGIEDFAEDEELNRYQNSVRYVDFFLKNLFDQYKEMGLYEDTVFVLYGDHGEGFGEHGRRQHDNAIYDEGLRIPLMIVDPRRAGERVETPVNQPDVLPTVTDMLGYRIRGGDYDGSSLLRPLPEDRTVMSSCWNEDGCLASIKGDVKYIHHFGDKPDEVYDLSEDPLEKDNLAEERPEVARERLPELLEWHARTNDDVVVDAGESPR
ncbi:LTA synthase family protein [Rubrobacter marinus]|nr:alkaline phosphatase family protein [Rubrobacter marinus]